jgi:hypothetical protein
LSEENLKKGRELINSSSIPENLDLDRISPWTFWWWPGLLPKKLFWFILQYFA